MKTKRGIMVISELAMALRADRDAKAAFDAMPPSHQAQYIQYVSDAKKLETRLRRVEKSIEMMKQWQAARGK